MTEFTYRRKTFATPKSKKSSANSSDGTLDSHSNAVTKSTFKRKHLQKATDSNPEDIQLSQPLTKRRRRKEDDVPNIEATATSTPDSKTDKSTKKSTSKKLSKPANGEVSSKTNSASIRTRVVTPHKENSTVTTSSSPVSSKSPGQSPRKKFVVTSESPSRRSSRIISMNTHVSLQQRIKPIIDKRLSVFERERDKYIVEAVKRIFKDFFEELDATRDTFVKSKDSESFLEDGKEWEEIRKKYQDSMNEKSKEKEENKKDNESINESLQKICLQVDKVNPILKDMEYFSSLADKFCNKLIDKVHSDSFKHFGGMDDPMKLISSITSQPISMDTTGPIVIPDSL